MNGGSIMNTNIQITSRLSSHKRNQCDIGLLCCNTEHVACYGFICNVYLVCPYALCTLCWNGQPQPIGVIRPTSRLSRYPIDFDHHEITFLLSGITAMFVYQFRGQSWIFTRQSSSYHNAGLHQMSET